MTALAPGRFQHTAVRHSAPEELTDALLPFVESALQSGDRVFVNLGADGCDRLRDAVGADAERIRWTDSSTWHPHPSRRLRAIQDLVDEEAPVSGALGRMLFIGQCPFDSADPDLVTEWERFDAVLNHALGGAPADMVCAYDAVTLPAEVIARVPSAHSHLAADDGTTGGPSVSAEYVEPEDYLLAHQIELAPLPSGAARVRGRVKPSEARALVRAVVRPDDAVSRARIEDLVVAASEIVTNAWNARATSVDFACWHADGEIGIQVDDDGPGLTDPLAGYRRPDMTATGGRGLWIVRQLADLVQIASGSHGTSVRARIRDGSRTASS